MNENIDLTKILKNCPSGTKFYSKVHGEVEFSHVANRVKYPIVVIAEQINNETSFFINFTSGGQLYIMYDVDECLLVPSKEQQDWSKFTAPWYKKERFDPKTLKAFDRVIARNEYDEWSCTLFSHINNRPDTRFIYETCESVYEYCIPYNDDTKHLVGTKDEVPDFYKYWED